MFSNGSTTVNYLFFLSLSITVLDAKFLMLFHLTETRFSVSFRFLVLSY